MNHYIRYAILVAGIFLLILASGCTGTGENLKDMQATGLEINNMSTGIGSVGAEEDNHDTQRFSYSIYLTNNNGDKVFIKELALALPQEFEERLISKQLNVAVNKEIDANDTIEISGSLDFNAKGLSKEEILKLNPRILAVKVINEQTISTLMK